jgi:isopentenyl-diphosphate Delta-isomerase
MPKRTPPKPTVSRKKQHVELTVTRDVGFRGKTTGLERWDFVHNALPELDFAAIDPSTVFLGKNLVLPFMISCMTGGYADALRINRALAEVCEEAGIAMGVGSQRQALEDSQYHRTFSIVREAAPSIPIIGNIGAAEVATMTSADGIRRLADLVGADGFAVHLNPLQELLQPEGTPAMRGVLQGIGMLVRGLSIPVVVKEIGAGLSRDVIRRILDTGVRHIDIAGAGGTSWAGVEILRREAGVSMVSPFWDWGIPTARAVRLAAELRGKTEPFTLIASGGIATGLDAAKCIALGADLVASARPMLKALSHGGKKLLRELIREWKFQLKGAMFLTGSRTVRDLQQAPLEEVGLT